MNAQVQAAAGQNGQGQPTALQLLDIDYIRPCSTTGKPTARSNGADEQRRHRLKKKMVQLGLTKAVADTFPNQNAQVWNAQSTRAEIWNWAAQSIPGWAGQYIGGIGGTGANSAADIHGKAGKGGSRSVRVGVAPPVVAPVAAQPAVAGPSFAAQPVVAPKTASAKTGKKNRAQANSDSESEEHSPTNSASVGLSLKQKRARSESEESIESPDELELQAIADERLERDLEAAFDALEALPPPPAPPVPQGDERDENGHYIDRTDRPWDPAYDTEPPEDDLPFPGYFTKYASVKKVRGQPEPDIIGLVEKSKRRGDKYLDRYGNSPEDVLEEHDLERLPVFKKMRRR